MKVPQVRHSSRNESQSPSRGWLTSSPQPRCLRKWTFSTLAYNGLILGEVCQDHDAVVNWCIMTEWALWDSVLGAIRVLAWWSPIQRWLTVEASEQLLIIVRGSVASIVSLFVLWTQATQGLKCYSLHFRFGKRLQFFFLIYFFGGLFRFFLHSQFPSFLQILAHHLHTTSPQHTPHSSVISHSPLC